MTVAKKDFELIAAALAAARDVPCGTVLQMHRTIAEELADRLRVTNPRFDRDRFLKAAGVQS